MIEVSQTEKRKTTCVECCSTLRYTAEDLQTVHIWTSFFQLMPMTVHNVLVCPVCGTKMKGVG